MKCQRAIGFLEPSTRLERDWDRLVLDAGLDEVERDALRLELLDRAYGVIGCCVAQELHFHLNTRIRLLVRCQ